MTVREAFERAGAFSDERQLAMGIGHTFEGKWILLPADEGDEITLYDEASHCFRPVENIAEDDAVKHYTYLPEWVQGVVLP